MHTFHGPSSRIEDPGNYDTTIYHPNCFNFTSIFSLHFSFNFTSIRYNLQLQSTLQLQLHFNLQLQLHFSFKQLLPNRFRRQSSNTNNLCSQEEPHKGYSKRRTLQKKQQTWKLQQPTAQVSTHSFAAKISWRRPWQQELLRAGSRGGGVVGVATPPFALTS